MLAWDNLSDFVHDFMKGLQIMVDEIAPDPGADNSMLPLASLPYKFDTTAYGIAKSEWLAPGYDVYEKNYGQQPWLFAFRLNLTNNSLRALNCSFLGKAGTGSIWNSLTAEDIEILTAAGNQVYNADAIEILNDYPTNEIVITCDSNAKVSFIPALHDNTAIRYKFPKYNGIALTTDKSQCIFAYMDTPYYDSQAGCWKPNNLNEVFYLQPDGTTASYHSTTIAVFGDTYSAEYLVNRLSQLSAHNDVINYNKSGHEYKLYYGDFYLIYALTDTNIYNYEDLFTGTNAATGQINIWNPSAAPIVTPTYNEVKHEEDPPTPEIISDNQEDGGQYEHAKFTKVYACTNSELENLYNWMGGGAAGSSGTSPVTVPDNFDPMERIVGLIGYPMEVPTSQTDETTFTFRNAANQTINTGWSTYKFWQMHNEIDFGTVDIPYWEDEANGVPFLDYSSTVEIYVPFCGVVGLDPQSVMGCTLSCKMFIDFMTGDCSAVVYTNYGGAADSQHPVAFLSGNCGSAEVVSANAFGALQGAKAYASHKMSQAILGGVKNLATSIIGGATTGFTRGAANPSGTGGSAGMKAGAIGSVIGGAMDLGVNLTLQNLDNQYAVQVAKNSLGTTISGDFGQSTSWHYMNKPYIKVTWPTPISKSVELYGKTYGVPVHKSGTLSEYTGYTICNNVDVSGIAGATASELATIKQFLETGVYIKEGGEG